MPANIAVHVSENGETASPYDIGKIVVYRKKNSRWNVLKEKDFILDKSLGIKELREKMVEALEFLNSCRIFVGLSVAGLPYYELEKAGFSVWEFEGKPLEFLDYVLAEEKEKYKQVKSRKKNYVMLTPDELSYGYYRISIKEIQENDTGITSKQVLLPFLRKGRFDSLEIICNHVPPWLQAELMGGGYSGDIEKGAHKEVKIILSRSCRQPCGK
jgi:Fe-only nitrogenase accessory protein AnfO